MTETIKMYDIAPAIDVLCALPAYVRVKTTTYDGLSTEGQTRDLPGPGRRLTMGGW
jgi:hypothetical protein